MRIFTFIMTMLLSFSVFAAEGRKELSAQVKKELTAVFQSNEKLHTAFFNYEQSKEQIDERAADLNRTIDGISDAEIKKLLSFSQKKLNEIKSAAGREANNRNYHMVSTALIHVLKNYQVEGGYNAYSCPMEKKNWVQNSVKMAAVHNPYDANMKSCGTKDSSF